MERTPSRLWAELDDETRRLAARAMYDGGSTRREADAAIARALRFREIAVRRLPVDQRVGHLLRSVHPDDSLASSLLVALHLGHRRELLETFLDELGVPQKDGLIDDSHDLQRPDVADLERAVSRLRERFDEREVAVYLASIVAMDPDIWSDIERLER